MEGAKFSVGDLHFSQGDGEISFCGAIEVGGWIEFGVDLMKGRVARYAMTPYFKPGLVEPRYSEFLTFIGISVYDEGNNRYLDTTLAYRQACLSAIGVSRSSATPGSRRTCCSPTPLPRTPVNKGEKKGPGC